MILNSSRTRWSHDRESDDSEDEETSPTEEYWAIPDDGWTLVERSHGKPRGISDGHRNRTEDSDGKLDNVGLRYDELDDIMDTKVLSNYRKEVDHGYVSGNHIRHQDSYSGCQTDRE